MDAEDSFIIPPSLFDKDKSFILIDIPFCETKENKSKSFIKKIHHFKNIKYYISIIKDQNSYRGCRFYHGLCSCTVNYIGESKRNVTTRWGEHNNPTHNSEPPKHLNENNQHNYYNDQLKSNKLLFFSKGV